MSELENFMAEVPQEGEDAFKETVEKETPAESPTGKEPEDDTSKTTEETPSEEPSAPEQKVDEKPKPFHEDPAIQDYINRQVQSRFDKALPEIEQSISQKFPQETNIPEWFGGNEAAWKAYQADQQGLVDKAKREAIAEFESRSKAEAERVAQANSYIDSQVAALQAEGKQFDRNELIKVVSDYRPINESGNWDFRKAYEIYELKNAKDR